MSDDLLQEFILKGETRSNEQIVQDLADLAESVGDAPRLRPFLDERLNYARTILAGGVGIDTTRRAVLIMDEQTARMRVALEIALTNYIHAEYLR
jgi:hypothetical protein